MCDSSFIKGGQRQDDKMNDELSEKDLIPVGKPLNEPFVGQEFESEAFHIFYNAYAIHMEFVIEVNKLSRSRRDASATGWALVCNKDGYIACMTNVRKL